MLLQFYRFKDICEHSEGSLELTFEPYVNVKAPNPKLLSLLELIFVCEKNRKNNYLLLHYNCPFSLS